MRPVILILCCMLTLPALARSATAQITLPDDMPPRAAAPAEMDRNLGIALAAWEKMSGYPQASQPDRHVVRDFAPVLLVDGSVVIPGLGVRLRPTMEAGRDVLEIVDMREFGAIWSRRDDPPFGLGGIGGLLGGTIFSLDQNLRSALSRSAQKKLDQGFSFPISSAVPYTHNGEPRVQIQSRRLRVDPIVRPMGRWVVAEPEPEDAPSPREEYDQLIADFQAMLDAAPCAVSGAEMMRLERQIELLESVSEDRLAHRNIRNDQRAACAIAEHGAYEIADLERLAVLRNGTCDDVANCLSQAMRDTARDLQRQVAPPNGFLDFARIGLLDLLDPSRRNLGAEDGRARKACILQYLENDLFAAR